MRVLKTRRSAIALAAVLYTALGLAAMTVGWMAGAQDDGGVRGQASATPTLDEIVLGAATVYTHTGNTLISQYATDARCEDGETFMGWDRFTALFGNNSKEWNGYVVHDQVKAGSTLNYDLWIVGSALAVESGRLNLNAICQPAVGNLRGRPFSLSITVTGTVPALAPESVYHGHHHTDPPHGDNVHDDDLTEFAEEVGESQCYLLDQRGFSITHWDLDSSTDNSRLTEKARAPWFSVIESEREHCCLAVDNSETSAACFSATGATSTPDIEPPLSE